MLCNFEANQRTVEQMEVRVLYQKLGLENEKVKRKAEEYSRLCSVKRPTGLGGVNFNQLNHLQNKVIKTHHPGRNM